MSITSYAQNFEDVMLWRALGHIQNGFYIDVGAQHPVIDSVSKAFYEHGWRGVHVEATTTYATLVRADRPDELVLQVALSDKSGSLAFYEIPDTGLSTGDAAIAEHHRSRGFSVVETVVPCITLADVFTQVGQRDVHWLKIDVEGMEAQVLAGWGDCPVRPWVLVVESTYPTTQIETHKAWEDMVLDRGYVHTYFDGLSRYYVLTDRPDLAQKFSTPPNIFDGFSLDPSVPYNGPTRDLMQQKEQRHQDALSLEHANAAHELQALHDTLRCQHAEREQAISQQLEISQERYLLFQQTRLVREQTLLEQTSQAKQEVENLLRTQAQREREVSAQLLSVQQQATRERTDLARSHAEKQRELGGQQAQREKVLEQQLHAHQQELRNLQKDRVKREHEAGHEKVDLMRSHSEQEHALLQQQVDRERAHSQQLLTQQEEFQRLQLQQAKSEQALLEENSRVRQQLQSLRDTVVQREQEVLAQLQTSQRQAAQEKAELLQKQSEQDQALHRQHTEREVALLQQLQELKQLIKRQQEERAQLENFFNKQIATLKNEIQTLHQAHNLQAQQHRLEISIKLDENNRLLEAHSALETHLKEEI